ncbi:aldolase/citrate lyase family protein [Geodermatophilus obscurus]|uniref:aldolase/citrate lyase family protein n=1 Tax=Geodermatophilus obscurus TaxID=1861 RepID=UPI001AA1826A
MVRVEANDPTYIGKVLDVGAGGVVVPLVDDETQAAATVAAATYPPAGRRSYGPMRSGLRGGPTPADSHATRLVIIMIETPRAWPTCAKSAPPPESTMSTWARRTCAWPSGAPLCRSRLRTSRPMASVPRRWSADGSALAAVKSCSSGGQGAITSARAQATT